MSKELLFKYVLALGDDALILGQRLSQWAYRGPFLEEDIALSNISLDMFGQANGFYEYAAQLDGSKSADDLAFLRNEREFFNHQMVEIENGHFGKTIARNFLHDVFNLLFYTKLSESKEIEGDLGQLSLILVSFCVEFSRKNVESLSEIYFLFFGRKKFVLIVYWSFVVICQKFQFCSKRWFS